MSRVANQSTAKQSLPIQAAKQGAPVVLMLAVGGPPAISGASRQALKKGQCLPATSWPFGRRSVAVEPELTGLPHTWRLQGGHPLVRCLTLAACWGCSEAPIGPCRA